VIYQESHQKVPGHVKIDERHATIGLKFKKRASPVELLTIYDQAGMNMGTAVGEFDPVLLSRILDVTETQVGIISVVFKSCDDYKLPLLHLNDLKKVLQYDTGAGKEEFQAEHGRISSSSTGTILRQLLKLEQPREGLFF
jgi:hypothetical protein